MSKINPVYVCTLEKEDSYVFVGVFSSQEKMWKALSLFPQPINADLVCRAVNIDEVQHEKN